MAYDDEEDLLDELCRRVEALEERLGEADQGTWAPHLIARRNLVFVNAQGQLAELPLLLAEALLRRRPLDLEVAAAGNEIQFRRGPTVEAAIPKALFVKLPELLLAWERAKGRDGNSQSHSSQVGLASGGTQ